MSLLYLITAIAANAPAATAPKASESRRSARAVITASATIVRAEKVAVLRVPKMNNKVERPVAQQRSVKKGVPYVEFY